jgi:hypothetical protein
MRPEQEVHLRKEVSYEEDEKGDGDGSGLGFFHGGRLHAGIWATEVCLEI